VASWAAVAIGDIFQPQHKAFYLYNTYGRKHSLPIAFHIVCKQLERGRMSDALGVAILAVDHEETGAAWSQR